MENKSILKTLGLITGTAALSAAVSYFTIRKLVDLALDREPPFSGGNMKFVSGVPEAPEMKAAAELAARCAEELEASDTEEVSIAAFDDIRLTGHWQTCGAPKRVIVAMHGWRSSWAHDFGVISKFWRAHDCCVLYAEQRGQHSSGGEYMGFGLLERFDCLSWIDWVNERTGGTLPIYLAGVSMGATAVLMASGQELPDNVCGIMADCGFTSPYAIWKHVAENNLHMPYGLYRRAVDDLCRQKIQLGAEEYSCPEALKDCRVPVLFIHGTDDHFVPVQMTYENYRACASSKELLIVPGADHGLSYLVEQERYEKTVLEFWEKYDHQPDVNKSKAATRDNTHLSSM